MKKIFKMLACALCAVTAFGVTAGCNNNTINDSENNLVIESYLGGYGIDWLYELKDKFESIYPGKTVQILSSVSLLGNEFDSKIKNRPSNNPVDLYFANAVNYKQYVAKGKEVLSGYDCVLEDITDVYDSNPYNESVSIRTKMLPSYVENYAYTDGRQFAMPWSGGVDGLVYNAKMFDDNDWDVPYTTKQLVKLADDMTAAKTGVPFIWPGNTGYWETVRFTWWAQYEGYQGYRDFYLAQTKDANGNPTGTFTDQYFMQEGRYESVKVLEDLIYGSKNSYTGSISEQTKSAQNYFLDAGNKIAMMPNGDWLENEMKNNYPIGSLNMKIMKTPVISSIIDTLKDKSITSDAMLIEVIKAVDEGLTSYGTVTAADFARVKEARHIAFNNGFNHEAMIPSYANAKPLAKDFLRLMASDIGLEIITKHTTTILPYNSAYYDSYYSSAGLSAFQKSKLEIMQDDVKFISNRLPISKLFIMSDLRPFFMYSPEIKIGGIGNDAITAAEFISNELEQLKANWKSYISAARITDYVQTIS